MSHNQELADQCSAMVFEIYGKYCDQGYDHEEEKQLATRDVDAFYEENKQQVETTHGRVVYGYGDRTDETNLRRIYVNTTRDQRNASKT